MEAIGRKNPFTPRAHLSTTAKDDQPSSPTAMTYHRPKPAVSLSSPLPQPPTPNTPLAFKSKSIPQPATDSSVLDFSFTTTTTPLPSRYRTNPMLKWDNPEAEHAIPELDPPAPIASSKRPPHAEAMPCVASQNDLLATPRSALGTGGYHVPLDDNRDEEDSHNEILDDDSAESFFYTPHNKLVKPLQTAFMSTGLLSKRNRQRANIFAAAHAPETPCKRLNTPFVVPQAPLLPTSTIDMPPTPTRATPFTTNAQIRSRKQKGVFTDSPIKLKRPNLTLRGDLVAQAKLTVASPSGPTTPISTDAESPLGMFSRSNSGYFRTPVPPLFRKRSSIMDTSDDWTDSPVASISSSSEDQLFSSSTAPPGMIDFLQAADGGDDKDGAALETGKAKKRRIALMEQLTQVNPPKAPKTPKTPRPPVNPTISRLYTTWANFLTKECLEELRDGDFEVDHPTPLRPPEQIDVDYFETQFTILSELGNGEFSIAYRVMDKTTGRVSAVKKTKEPFTGWRDRMDRLEEVKHMWTIGQHPHCVELINAWEQDGHLYIQEELCAWGSLDTFAEEYSQRDRLEEARIWRMLAELALGLKRIHDSQVLHLDLKPANVFITEIGSLKIGDFGMAAAWPVGKGVDREGDRQYMGPEVLSGNLDKPADIFSLGLTIFEIATNVVLPDNGPQWQKLREGDISATNLDSLSDELVDLIRSMLHPDPQKRPTVDEVLADPMVAKAVEAKDDDELGALDGLVEVDDLLDEVDDLGEMEGEDDGNAEGDVVEGEEENGTQYTPSI